MAESNQKNVGKSKEVEGHWQLDKVTKAISTERSSLCLMNNLNLMLCVKCQSNLNMGFDQQWSSDRPTCEMNYTFHIFGWFWLNELKSFPLFASTRWFAGLIIYNGANQSVTVICWGGIPLTSHFGPSLSHLSTCLASYLCRTHPALRLMDNNNKRWHWGLLLSVKTGRVRL